jgi:hypothetical protein
MPRAMRERTRLIVLQAWFDDSGKEGIAQSPVYLLAGYFARVKVWENFVDDWQAELNRAPKLRWLHSVEAYHLKGEFGFNKDTQKPSEWVLAHGRGNKKARDERVLRFTSIITKHLKRGIGEGITWILKHKDYAEFVKITATHPRITPEELTRIKNPYYLSFEKVFGDMLKIQGAKKTEEQIHILFDEDIDDPDSLEVAFKSFVKTVRENSPRHLRLLVNKKAEFRNDKCFPPLQAADLLAWHVRRFCFESARGRRYEDPVWDALRSQEMKIRNYLFTVDEWRDLLRGVGFALLPIR